MKKNAHTTFSLRNIVLTIVFSAISLANGQIVHAKDLPGAAETSYGVSPSGAFQTQIPIVIPSGTNGMQPNLSLNFSSSGGNGRLGVGWQLNGLSAITRCGKTIATHGVKGGVLHNADDRFCLDGQVLILASGTYGAAGSTYRTEIDSFARITATGSSANINGGSAPLSFTVEHKDGMISHYGTTDSSRIFLPGHTTSIHCWKLARREDRNGNYYEATYNANSHPVSIDYTMNTGLSADKKVEFVYETRPDVRTHYIAGKKRTDDIRLKRIDVSKDNTQVRQYTLAYEIAPVTLRSRITSITECGLNASECMPPIRIDWKAETKGFKTATAEGDKPKEIMMRADRGFVWDMGEWVDVNGDGLVDQVIAYINVNGHAYLKTYLQTRDNRWVLDNKWKLPMVLRTYDTRFNTKGRLKTGEIRIGEMLDVNGDGLVDLVYSYEYSRDSLQRITHVSHKNEVYLNNGNGWSLSTTYRAPYPRLYSYIVNHADTARTLTQRGRFVDVNGDGLVDYVESYHNGGTNTHHRRTFLNTGTNWVENAAYKMPDTFQEFNKTRSITRGELVDVNGDGLVDWLQAVQVSGRSQELKAWINTGLSSGGAGSAWQRNDAYALPVRIHENFGPGNWDKPVTRGSLIDVNGDGLRDYVESFRNTSGASKRTWLNTGKGWVRASSYDTPFVHLDHANFISSGKAVQVQGNYVDVNRDGLVDFIESWKVNSTHHRNTWINTGATSGAVGTSWVKRNEYNTGWTHFDYSGSAPHQALGQFVDMDSNGSADWVKAAHNSGATPLLTKLNRLGKTDQLEKITTTMGVEIKPTFLPLTANDTLYSKTPLDDSNNPLSPVADAFYLVAPICVVSQLQVSSANGLGYNTTSYQYSGAQVHRKGRGHLGFQSRTVIDEDKDLVVYQEFKQAFPFTGRVSKVAVMDRVSNSGQTPISLTTTDYSYRRLAQASGANTWFPYVRKTLKQTHELEDNGGAAFSYSNTTATFDDYGNLTSSHKQTGPNASTIQSETLVNQHYYPANLSNWLIGQLKDQVTTLKAPSQPDITRSTGFSYDTQGRLTRKVREPNSSDANVQLTTRYSYDNYGNVLSETNTDLNNESRTDTIAYDNDHSLPIRLSNALNQTSRITYHPQCDQPQTVTDANGLITKYEYDNFCRQTRVTNPAGIQSTTDYIFGIDVNCPVSLRYGDPSSGPSFPRSTCSSSGFSLRIRTKNDGEASITTRYNRHSQATLSTTTGMLGQTIRQETEYDQFGRTVATTQPYFDNDTPYWTRYHYDKLDRLTSTELPWGNSHTDQNYGVDTNGQQVRTSIDAKGNATTSYANALGQVVKITDALNNALRYEFDAQGNLTQTFDAHNNSIVVGYDLLGRRTRLDDPDLGLSTFRYNAFGELIAQTDNKGQILGMTYDKLGRMTTRTVPGSDSAGVSTFTYDTVDKGIGALAAITGPNGYRKTYRFDAFGRASSNTTTIRGGSYTQSLSYDEYGRVNTRSYPQSGSGNPFSVQYHYLNGYLSSITGVADENGVCLEHWRANEYDALGRTRQDTLGKIVTTTRTYDPAQGVLNKIDSVMLVNQGQTVQNLNYSYDAINNLSSRTSGLSGEANYRHETFAYDDLYRLISHDDGSEAVSVTYDGIGNITYKSDVGDYDYSGQGGPHAVSRVNSPLGSYDPLAKFQVNWEWNGETVTQPQANITDSDYQYDQNGNITRQGNRHLSWTAFDKPASMVLIDPNTGLQRGNITEYDADFQRIYKLEGTFSSLGNIQTVKEETIYIGKAYEKITDASGNIKHRYTISTGNSAIQIERADGTNKDRPKYLLGDHLGSTHVILNAMGKVEQTLEFDPWGMRVNAGSTAVNQLTNQGYTGHEMDDEVGLINMNARVYDPILGRFLSADPVLPNPYNMQSFNRYAYVINNPLSYTDPTGNVEKKNQLPVGTTLDNQGRRLGGRGISNGTYHAVVYSHNGNVSRGGGGGCANNCAGQNPSITDEQTGTGVRPPTVRYTTFNGGFYIGRGNRNNAPIVGGIGRSGRDPNSRTLGENSNESSDESSGSDVPEGADPAIEENKATGTRHVDNQGIHRRIDENGVLIIGPDYRDVGEVNGQGGVLTIDGGNSLEVSGYSHTQGVDPFSFDVSYNYVDSRSGKVLSSASPIGFSNNSRQTVTTGFSLGFPTYSFRAPQLRVGSSYKVRWRVSIPRQYTTHQNSAGWNLRVRNNPYPRGE